MQNVHEYYIKTNGTLSFRACVPGERLQASNCVRCSEGTYLLKYNAKTEVCSPCPGNAEMCHDNVIVLKEGFWRRTDVSEVIHPCGLHGCVGGNGTGDSLCAVGYQGIMCSICSDGYHWVDESSACEVCSGEKLFSPSFIIFLMIVIALAPAAIVYMYYQYYAPRNFGQDPVPSCTVHPSLSKLYETSRKYYEIVMKYYNTRNKTLSLYLKLITSTYQICCSSSNTFQVSYPASLSSFFAAFQVLNFSLIKILPLSCSYKFDFVDKLLISTLAPMFVCAAFFASLAGQIFFSRLKILRSNSENKNQEIENESRRLKFQYFNLFLIMSFLILPSVTTTIFQMFPCQNIDPMNEDDLPNTYLVADYSIDCESPRYDLGVAIAVLMVFIYPIGIPALYFYCLHQKREEIMNRNNLAKMVDGKPNLPEGLIVLEFLFRAYRPEFWYFEILETYRRLSLTAILSVIATGSSAQTVCAMSLAMVFVKSYDKLKPYEKDRVARIAEIGQIQTLFTFFGAHIIRGSLLGSDANSLVAASLILINLSVVLVPIYYELNEPKISDKKVESGGPAVASINTTKNPILEKSENLEDAIELTERHQRSSLVEGLPQVQEDIAHIIHIPNIDERKGDRSNPS